MQDFLIMHISSKMRQRLSQFLVGARDCIAHFVKRMQVVTLQGDEIGISQKPDGITLFDKGNRCRGSNAFLLQYHRIFEGTLSLRLSDA